MRIELTERAESALSRLALDQNRDVRRQAEALILEGLRRRRLLTIETAAALPIGAATRASTRETR